MANGPSLEECRRQARSYSEMNADVLLLLSSTGDPGARIERMIREAMVVGDCDWKSAATRVEAMAGKMAGRAPGLLGLGLAQISLIIGAGSLPMVFNYDVALWFNERFVTADVPEPKDLETWLEVGSWAWNWMEPPLGTISFVILCVQLARDALHRRGDPISNYFRRRREQTLLASYPEYAPLILLQWADAVRGDHAATTDAEAASADRRSAMHVRRSAAAAVAS